ncbi:hypothetical protein HZB00_02565 [Candidatus Woesearchaeota archaeon]|nr:hypothetical protein [Candidatus Woesearchaeota archaeon]
MIFPPRAITTKLWISHLYSIQKSPTETNLFLFRNKPVLRINLIGLIIETHINPAKTYASITIDDGSGSITVKAWNEDAASLLGYAVGDLALVIGRFRDGQPPYLLSEVVRKLSPAWLQYRKLELTQLYGNAPAVLQSSSPSLQQTQRSSHEDEEPSFVVVEEKIDETPAAPTSKRSVVAQLIETLNSGDGADYSLVVQQSGLSEQEAEHVIQELIKDGEVFQNKPGKLCSL